MKYLAIDVGGTFIKYAIITDECEILFKSKRPTVLDTLENFLFMLEEIYEEYKGDVDGVAISAAGIIDSEAGFMYTGGSLKCIENFNIVDYLESRFHVPVTVENDAKCAALAEVWKGALKDCKDGVVMVCGTGIGGAIVHDRKVLRGIHHMAGEFSFILTDAGAKLGTQQMFAERSGVKNLMKITSKHTDIPEEDLNGEKVFAMANEGDERAIESIREYVYRLAIQINNFQFIIDPEKIAVGGGISVQPLFLQLLKEELEKINAIYDGTIPLPIVEVCKFFNDANLIGAVYVHMNQRGKKWN